MHVFNKNAHKGQHEKTILVKEKTKLINTLVTGKLSFIIKLVIATSLKEK